MKNGMPSGSGTPYRSVFEEGASLTQYLVSSGTTTERLYICRIVIYIYIYMMFHHNQKAITISRRTVTKVAYG